MQPAGQKKIRPGFPVGQYISVASTKILLAQLACNVHALSSTSLTNPMLSTYCFAHLVGFSFGSVFDIKLSVTRLLRLEPINKPNKETVNQ